MDRRCQLPFRASGSSSSLMAVRYTEPIRTLGRSTLAASTKSLGDRVEIRIRDNGTGIPPEVKEKMFNPFFTTSLPEKAPDLGSQSVMTSLSSSTVAQLRLKRSRASSPKSG
jgi:phosphoglycerate-specific signal transduction histidine kinase